MRGALLIAPLLLAACETPPLSLRFTLTDGNSQQCFSDNGIETTKCDQVTMVCDGVLSVRVVPPNTPEFPYISVCERLVGGNHTLCSIAGVDLPQPAMPIPEQVLEVQMAVFSAQELETVDGKYVCPPVEFAANNLPVMIACSSPDPTECAPRPAVGGRAFYHPGDSETTVELGCTDFQLLNGENCVGARKIEVMASVNEFGSPAGVDMLTASRLLVSVGEPKATATGSHTLSLLDTRALPRLNTSVPTWSAEIELDEEMPTFELVQSYCIEVLEDTFQATRTVTCRPLTAPNPERIDGLGVHLVQSDLEKILKAYNSDGTATFPAKGLVLGIILDSSSAPVAGGTVSVMKSSCGPTSTPRPCTVKYLSADGLTFNGTSTSSKGIFISDEAPYGSEFVWSGQVQPSFGGLVEGKVTIVIIQESGIGNM